MSFKLITLSAAALLLTTNVDAAIITHGNLQSDNTTDFITDTVTGRMYTRGDVTSNWSYQQTLSAIQVGGTYEGWSIATETIANDFINSLMSPYTNACTGITSGWYTCGNIDSWSDGDFGESMSYNLDWFGYIADHSPNSFGIVELYSVTNRVMTNDYISIDGYPAGLILYKEQVVPIPAAAWLFGSGLIGLVGLARKNKA